jgi:nicotinamide phosphoribosyltransferase
MILNENNFIFKTDSYKTGHWKQYPKNTTSIYSYMESRGGKFEKTVWFGAQYIVAKHLAGVVVTKEMLDEAIALSMVHIGYNIINVEGWNTLINKYGGNLPVRIKAAPEGLVIPTKNVLMTIECTDVDFFWLTNYIETILMQVWYPTTVATNSFYAKKIIKKYLEKTHGDTSSLNLKLVDFGFRGVSCWEQAAIGGAAHLVNFEVTDNLAGIIMANNYYNSGICGYSIPASEHSTITTWGKEHEVDAMRNMLTSYPTGPVACVSDSFDIYNACDNIYGKILKDEIKSRNGTLIVRPDSGDPVEVNSKIIDLLWNRFGGDYNTLGFKVLDPHIRVIQGDGVDLDSIEAICHMYKTKGFSTENISFGSGGALLMKFDRDTNKFAIKCSSATIDGKEVGVMKDPITDPGKVSKQGHLKLHQSGWNAYSTMSSLKETPGMFNAYIDTLETIFENGEVIKSYDFATIRKNAEEALKY